MAIIGEVAAGAAKRLVRRHPLGRQPGSANGDVATPISGQTLEQPGPAERRRRGGGIERRHRTVEATVQGIKSGKAKAIGHDLSSGDLPR